MEEVNQVFIENKASRPDPVFERQYDVPPLKNMPSREILEEHLLKPWEIQKVAKQREQLNRCENVAIFSNAHGLGDSIMELRLAGAMARKTPQKNYELFIPPSVAEIPYFSLPPNVSIKTSLTKEELQQKASEKNTFFMTFHNKDSFVDSTISGLLGLTSEEETTIFKGLSEEGFLSDSFNTLGSITYGEMGEKTPAFPVNFFDYSIACRLRLLGISIDERSLREPLLSFSDEIMRAYSPEKYDFLIAPDAAEGDTEDQTRSVKSFSPELWKNIFEKLPPGTKVGIVQGVSHPEYTRHVLVQARSLGLDVTDVQTPTLTDFCHEVLQAKTFIGMDSGTTHIAYEVMSAAKIRRRKIQIKEIFNILRTHRVSPEVYALRGNTDLVKVLLCKPTDTGDNVGIPAERVANFIFHDSISNPNFLKALIRRLK